MSGKPRGDFVEGRHYEIDPETGCWNWLQFRDRKGYGMTVVTKGDGRERRAYRESWRLAHGPIPKGLVIDHLCRNPSCINPEHLDCVTQAVNCQRGLRATFTAADATAIRARAAAGESLTTIAQEYGVTVNATWSIATDRCWRVDPDAPRQPIKPVRNCRNCGERVIGQRNKFYCNATCRERFNGRARYYRLKAAAGGSGGNGEEHR